MPAKKNDPLPEWDDSPIRTSIERLKLLADEAHKAGNAPLAKSLYDSIGALQVKLEHSDLVSGRTVGREGLARLGHALAELVMRVIEAHVTDPDTKELMYGEVMDGIEAVIATAKNEESEIKLLTKKAGAQR